MNSNLQQRYFTGLSLQNTDPMAALPEAKVGSEHPLTLGKIMWVVVPVVGLMLLAFYAAFIAPLYKVRSKLAAPTDAADETESFGVVQPLWAAKPEEESDQAPKALNGHSIESVPPPEESDAEE